MLYTLVANKKLVKRNQIIRVYKGPKGWAILIDGEKKHRRVNLTRKEASDKAIQLAESLDLEAIIYHARSHRFKMLLV